MTTSSRAAKFSRTASDQLVGTVDAEIDYDHFAEIAEMLARKSGGVWLGKFDDGFSTRYWDLSVRGTTVCFHFHDWICEFEIISMDGEASDAVVRELVEILSAGPWTKRTDG